MLNSDYTTIKVKKITTKRLKSFAVHPREPYDDIITRALQGELHPEDPNRSKGDASDIVEYDDLKKMKQLDFLKIDKERVSKNE